MPFPPFPFRPGFCDFGTHSGSALAGAIEDLFCGFDFGLGLAGPVGRPIQPRIEDCGPDLVRDPATGECVLRVPVTGRVPRVPRVPRETFDLRRIFMPFTPPFLPGGARTGIGGIIGDVVQRLPRLPLPRSPRVPEVPGFPLPPFMGPPMLGKVSQQGCGCVIEKQVPAHIRRMKGKAVFGPDGQFLGCTPKRRSINPMNGRAATRAARRLKSVMKFQRRIEKAIRRACGSKSRGGFRTRKSCGGKR